MKMCEVLEAADNSWSAKGNRGRSQFTKYIRRNWEQSEERGHSGGMNIMKVGFPKKGDKYKLGSRNGGIKGGQHCRM